MGDQIQEHSYWGSARDRMPQAQTSELTRSGIATRPEEEVTGRYRALPLNNLCLIRSGQDWSTTTGKERDKYLNEVEPRLSEGMKFLRDEGEEVGCLNCLYMDVLDPDTALPVEKTFGLAWFSDMSYLEKWARSHESHLAIFGGFMQYVKELDFNIQLRLYHEITVIPVEGQFFEYINCIPRI